MSKSRGNVINPDDIVHRYGADSLRLYEMFLGPLQDTKVSNSRQSLVALVLLQLPSAKGCATTAWLS